MRWTLRPPARSAGQALLRTGCNFAALRSGRRRGGGGELGSEGPFDLRSKSKPFDFAQGAGGAVDGERIEHRDGSVKKRSSTGYWKDTIWPAETLVEKAVVSILSGVYEVES